MAMLSTIIKRTIFSTQLTKHTFATCSSNKDKTIVTTAITILKHHRSKSRWSELLTLTPPPTKFTPSQVSQIIIQLRNTPHLALNFFHFTIQRSICNHSLYSYATIIHILSRSRFKNQALELIKSAIIKFPDTHLPDLKNPPRIFQILVKSYTLCDSAPFVFDLLVKGYLDCKKIDLAVLLVRLLASKNIFPHVVVCNCLIELVAKRRGPFVAYDMYREVFRCEKEKSGVIANVYTFNVLMVGFYREGVIEKVDEVWKEMAAKDCVPNTYSYSVLMAAYCEDGRMEDAVKVWEEMNDKGVKCDVVAYNTIIEGFCKVGEVERAEEVFREMVFDEVECSCVTLEHLVNGHCMSGNVDAALLLYKDMCRKGFKPESSTIDAMARVLCEKNGVFEALEFVRDVIKKHDIVPRKATYELLIRSLCQEGWMEEAQNLQAEMVGKGYAPDVETYSAFIDGFTKQGNEEMVETLRNEMVRTKIPCKDN